MMDRQLPRAKTIQERKDRSRPAKKLNKPAPKPAPAPAPFPENLNPIFNGKISAGGGFFDPGYVKTENRQHLGIDIGAAAGTSVRSPVTGAVLRNETSREIMQANLVIKSDAGPVHVLGHISSTLLKDAKVKAGDVVGTVRAWPANGSHVHWGANSFSVDAINRGKEQWGWGRAPVSVTKERAIGFGWLDLTRLLVNA